MVAVLPAAVSGMYSASSRQPSVVANVQLGFCEGTPRVLI